MRAIQLTGVLLLLTGSACFWASWGSQNRKNLWRALNTRLSQRRTVDNKFVETPFELFRDYPRADLKPETWRQRSLALTGFVLLGLGVWLALK